MAEARPVLWSLIPGQWLTLDVAPFLVEFSCGVQDLLRTLGFLPVLSRVLSCGTLGFMLLFPLLLHQGHASSVFPLANLEAFPFS